MAEVEPPREKEDETTVMGKPRTVRLRSPLNNAQSFRKCGPRRGRTIVWPL